VNVAADVKLRRGRRTSQRDKIIPTKDEIRLIMERAPESHRALFVTAILTGMRISELRGLAWEAVDFERRLVSVRQRADAYGQIGAPKSRAGFRDIPMAPTVQRTLQEWQGKAPESDLGLVFPNASGKPQNYANIYNRVFRPMMVDLGIEDEHGDPKFGIHALRHAVASLFIEQGWNPKQIQTLLGHASITMTMDVYGHLFDNAEEAVAMFEKMEKDLMAA
jgi:integrase